MSNHQHTLLRTRPDVLEKITDEEVARRWLRLYPNKVVDEETAFAQLMNQKQRLVTLRKRLGSISWFMKSLSEHIARRANKEDQCKGRFWEGRFRCQRVCDEAARLACSIYIDLNPIRAELAKTPEKSKYTSAWERIRSIHRNSPAEREPSLWIAPIHSTEKRRGYLSISLPEYLQLLDATGREVHRGKKGRIPNQLAPILERIGVKTEHWLDTITHYGRWFALFSGKKNSLQVAAIETGRRWVKGSAAAARVFT